MTLYEVDTDPMAEYGYFWPVEPTAYEIKCGTCGWPIAFTEHTPNIKWSGGDEPGDFVSAMFGTFAKKSVGEELRSMFPELELRSMSVLNRKDSAGKGRDRYEGEEIVWLGSRTTILLNANRCSLKTNRRTFNPCPECRRTVGELDGIEIRPTQSPAVSRPPNWKKRLARWPGKGVFLYSDELGDSNFFFLNGPGRLYCTDRAKAFIDERRYTNVDLAEVGVTIKRGDPIPIQATGSAPLGYRPQVPVAKARVEPRTFTILGLSAVPMDIEGIKRFRFQVPKLAEDSQESCPTGLEDLSEYLDVESGSEGPYILDWCRSAEIEDTKYWLWQFDEDGADAFVYVAWRSGQTTIGMNSAHGLSPEQFLVLEHLRSR